MKREIRALADEAYTILNDSESEAAVERALQVLATAPEDPESYLLMCEIAEENRRYDHALMWINRGLAHHPHHEGLLLKKSSILLDGFEDIDEAFLLLTKITRGFANKPIPALKRDLGAKLLLDVYLLLTDLFRLKTELNEALRHATIAKEIAPFDENAHLALATAHFELGDYHKALIMIEPIDQKAEPADFYWLKAQILCSEGNFVEADATFAQAFKLDKSRYHRPCRLEKAPFLTAFHQALQALPKEIREFIQTTAVEIQEIVPVDVVKKSRGGLSPQSCIAIETVKDRDGHQAQIISVFQKNIENLAGKKEDIKDLIASALLHELGKLVT